MENYNKELEKNLLEMVKQKEENDRRLLALEWVIGILSCLVIFLPILFGQLVPIDDRTMTLLMFFCLIPAFVGFAFAVRIEQIAGYYECKHCGHRYVPSYKEIIFAPHVGRTRKLKCPECGERSWQKKVLEKSASQHKE